MIKSFTANNLCFCNYTELSETQSFGVWKLRTSDHIRQFMCDKSKFSFESHMDFIDRLRKDNSKAYFAIYDKNKELVSAISLHPIDYEKRTADWGIFVNPHCCMASKGTITANAFFEHIKSLNIVDTITAQVFAFNRNSLRFHLSVGFVETHRDGDIIYLTKTL